MEGSIKMTPVIKAVLLTAFVLPGLGQISLGHKVRGIILIMITTLLTLPALFLLMKGVAVIMAFKMTGAQLGLGELQSALGAYALPAKIVIGSFISIWVFSIVDIFSMALRENRSTAN
jgi:TM2 domain-containing membrane protein YozV